MIKPTVSVQTKKNMLKAITDAVRRGKGSSVAVGVQKGAGVYKVKGNSPAPTVAQVALWNEYGTVDMPARPFLGPAIRENRAILDEERNECARLMFFEGWTVERALSRLGFFVQQLVQNKIKSNPGPELSGSWDDPVGKGSGYLGEKRRLGQGQVRLIATGLLLRSIQYKVMLAASAQAESDGQDKPGTQASEPVSRAHGRAAANAQKEANKARRAAHKEEFTKFKAKVRAAKKVQTTKETAVRHADGRAKTRTERAAHKKPKD